MKLRYFEMIADGIVFPVTCVGDPERLRCLIEQEHGVDIELVVKITKEEYNQWV